MPFNYAFQKYSEAISRFSLFKTGDRVLVGFSGGADSTLLLTLLSKTEGITVAAAHLNHGIRGDEAERDERFCKEFCEKNQIKLFISHANVPEIAKETSKTVEEAARDARYSFFDKIFACFAGCTFLFLYLKEKERKRSKQTCGLIACAPLMQLRTLHFMIFDTNIENLKSRENAILRNP